jgi:hypothetical protein
MPSVRLCEFETVTAVHKVLEQGVASSLACRRRDMSKPAEVGTGLKGVEEGERESSSNKEC